MNITDHQELVHVVILTLKQKKKRDLADLGYYHY